jgi:predicted nucleotidyltransferase
MNPLIENKLSEIVLLCKKHQVASFALFGSATNNDFKSTSDVDFLVQFSDNIDVLEYATNYFSLLESLENLLGKKIDLVSKKSLKNPVLIASIEQSKIELYAA